MKRFFLVLFLFLTMVSINAQKQYELFPSNLNIQPFTANNLEPKMGFLFQQSGKKIRLDIGNSTDAVNFNLSNTENFSVGIDFFTYTYLYSENDFHFPVDAVDYLFGVNFGYKNKSADNEYGIRMRISHISAHFVDGHRDNINQIWKDNINPVVYSREFIELIPFYKFNNFRIYTGFTYLFHVTPTTIGKEIYQIGVDWFAKDLICSDITPFAGCDFKLQKIDYYKGNTSVSAGIKIGKPNGRGLSIYYNYYAGKSIHGEYYYMDEKISSIGFNVDL
ncbi:MAG: DUF1207 domain-containing protein [bacterium]